MLNLIKRLIIQPRQARLLQEGIFREAVRGYEMNQEGFPDRLHLPKPFAVGLPERAVELMLARLLYRSDESTLDIGHANATPSHRRLLVAMPTPRNLTGIDIADPVYDTRPFYARSVRADITANPFKDGEFKLDLVYFRARTLWHGQLRIHKSVHPGRRAGRQGVAGNDPNTSSSTWPFADYGAVRPL